MSRGLSALQRQALDLLVTSKWRPLDVTEELLPRLGLKSTDATRRSLLRSMRNLRDRGLVTLEKVPSERGGWPRYMVAAKGGDRG